MPKDLQQEVSQLSGAGGLGRYSQRNPANPNWKPSPAHGLLGAPGSDRRMARYQGHSHDEFDGAAEGTRAISENVSSQHVGSVITLDERVDLATVPGRSIEKEHDNALREQEENESIIPSKPLSSAQQWSSSVGIVSTPRTCHLKANQTSRPDMGPWRRLLDKFKRYKHQKQGDAVKEASLAFVNTGSSDETKLALPAVQPHLVLHPPTGLLSIPTDPIERLNALRESLQRVLQDETHNSARHTVACTALLLAEHYNIAFSSERKALEHVLSLVLASLEHEPYLVDLDQVLKQLLAAKSTTKEAKAAIGQWLQSLPDHVVIHVTAESDRGQITPQPSCSTAQPGFTLGGRGLSGTNDDFGYQSDHENQLHPITTHAQLAHRSIRESSHAPAIRTYISQGVSARSLETLVDEDFVALTGAEETETLHQRTTDSHSSPSKNRDKRRGGSGLSRTNASRRDSPGVHEPVSMYPLPSSLCYGKSNSAKIIPGVIPSSTQPTEVPGSGNKHPQPFFGG